MRTNLDKQRKKKVLALKIVAKGVIRIFVFERIYYKIVKQVRSFIFL